MTNNFQSSIPPDQPVVPSTPSYTSPYLPAGAPPWPTTVLQRPLPMTASSIDTMAGKISDRKPRTARGVLTTLGLIALTLLVGAALTYGVLYANGQVDTNGAHASRLVTLPTVTSQPTAGTNPSTPSTSTGSTLPTPTSFSTMSADHQKTLGVLVKYPSDWVEDPATQPASDGTAVAAFRPQQQALNIVVYLGKFSVTASQVTTTTGLNQALIGTIYGTENSGNTNIQTVQTTSPHRTIAGVQWDQLEATFSDANGSLIHVMSISVKRGSFFYGFIIQTPDLYYNDLSQKYVPPMLDSFKFLS